MEATLWVAWGSLLAAPPLAFAVARKGRLGAWKPFALGSVGLISAVMLAIALDASFVWADANIWTLCVAYLGYCFLAFSCMRIKWKLVRYAVSLLAVVPIALGYVLGTIGMLGLGFIIGDLTQPPVGVEKIDGGLVCKMTRWGAAMTDSGYRVTAYRQLGPFLEQRLAKISVNESTGQHGVDCSDVAALVR